MGSRRWGWIVPDGLWETAEPLLPPARVRPQGGGVASIDDEAVFVANIYVLVSGCAWRTLPACFGASKSTVHCRFVIWSRAGMWGRLHQEILQLLDERDVIDLSRAVLVSAHVRANKGGELAGPSLVDRGKPDSRTHVLSDTDGLPLRVGLSAANTHDSQALKPRLSHSTWDTNPTRRNRRSAAFTPTRRTTFLTCGDGSGASRSGSQLLNSHSVVDEVQRSVEPATFRKGSPAFVGSHLADVLDRFEVRGQAADSNDVLTYSFAGFCRRGELVEVPASSRIHLRDRSRIQPP